MSKLQRVVYVAEFFSVDALLRPSQLLLQSGTFSVAIAIPVNWHIYKMYFLPLAVTFLGKLSVEMCRLLVLQLLACHVHTDKYY